MAKKGHPWRKLAATNGGLKSKEFARKVFGFRSKPRVGIVMFNRSAADNTRERLQDWGKSKKIKGSKEQEMIWAAMESKTENILVEAYAGTGKTTTSLEGLHRLKGEASVECVTSHGLMLSVYRQQFPHVQVKQYKVHDIVNQLMGISRGADVGKEKQEVRDGIVEIVSCFKNTFLQPTIENYYLLLNRFGIDFGANDDDAYETIVESLEISDSMTGVIDFDDMIYLPVKMQMQVENKFKFLVVDEAQDYNTVQRIGAYKLTERLMVIGDPFQCQPPGTLVRLSGGEIKPIEKIEVGDQVVSYNSKQTYFPGLYSQGRSVEKVAKRFYSGELITIHAGGKTAQSTPEHRWLVRLTDRESYALYLMVKGNYSRIGVCRLSYKNGYGPGMRARQEGAEKSFLLAVYPNAEEARIAEVINAAKFGLPQTVFQNTGQLSPSQDFIDEVYQGIGDNIENAKRCVAAFGRQWDYPIWSKNGNNYVAGSKTFVTQASNIVSGAFKLCVFTGNARKPNWALAKVERENYSGMVYSLKVQPTEGGRRLYLSNDIVTHNSIYAFRGAEAKSMAYMAEDLELKSNGGMGQCGQRGLVRLPLYTTRRCPIAVVESVKEFVPLFRAAKGATQGSVDWLEYGKGRELYLPGDMILSRLNAPLCNEAFDLLTNGVKCKIQGRNFGKSLVRFVKSFKAGTITELRTKLEKYYDSELKKLRGKAKYRLVDNLVQTLSDKVRCLRLFAATRDSVGAVITAIESMFDDDLKDRSKIVLLSSIHRAKGDEANRVFLLERDQLPMTKMVKTEDDLQQEINCVYVGHTRAADSLYLVESNPNEKKWGNE